MSPGKRDTEPQAEQTRPIVPAPSRASEAAETRWTLRRVDATTEMKGGERRLRPVAGFHFPPDRI